jgi:hypothetical protein
MWYKNIYNKFKETLRRLEAERKSYELWREGLNKLNGKEFALGETRWFGG